MAREPAYDHINIGYIDFSSLVIIENLVYVPIDAATLPKTLLIAAPRELLAFGSGRFPLISPNSFERTGSRKIEFRSILALVAFEAQAKTTNASKEFGYRNHFSATNFLLIAKIYKWITLPMIDQRSSKIKIV